MPFTIPEALSDLPEASALINKIASLPLGQLPAGHEAEESTKMISSVLPQLGALIDKIRAQAKD